MKQQTNTAKAAFQSARSFLRCNAGSWSRAFDMACRNDDIDALPMLNAAKRAYDHRHDRDPLRLGGSLKFRQARRKLFSRYDARAELAKAA